MIYTLTLNPAVDLVVKMHGHCKIDTVNRAYFETMVAGGKGINVSRALKSLDTQSIAIGFVGGFTGEFLNKKLISDGIATDFVYINNPTRINVKLINDNRATTEINAPSPDLTAEDIDNIIKKFEKVNENDIVIISGALPQSFPLDVFDNLLKMLVDKKTPFVIDMSGKQLLTSLRYKPFLVKPNRDELTETLYCKIENHEDIIKGAKRLQTMGAQNVIVSLGADGAVLVNQNMTLSVPSVEGNPINTVGAGDSLIAGFIAEYLKTKSYEYALHKAMIVAGATILSNDIATKQEILNLSKKVEEKNRL